MKAEWGSTGRGVGLEGQIILVGLKDIESKQNEIL